MTSPTKRRTFTPDQFHASRTAWDASGPWSAEWKPWRHMAAMEAGIIFPPDGTAWDSWDDDSPSQRAILVRAIRETPQALAAAIRAPGVRSWGDVIARIIGQRVRLAEAAEERERDWRMAKARRSPTRIGETLAAVVDSLS